MRELPVMNVPPGYCEYAAGPCEEQFDNLTPAAGLFLYSSRATQVAGTIDGAVTHLRQNGTGVWRTWKEFPVAGQLIFCEVCKGIRGAETVVADVTTLNFNLMFEIGFAIGLGKPVIPIRDTTILSDMQAFRDLGMLDTLGYVDFQNSAGLAESLVGNQPYSPLADLSAEVRMDTPLYVVKGPHQTEGDVRLTSVLENSALNYREFDPVETSRMSLHQARKEVAASLGVLVHLISPERTLSQVHNARSALIAGLAMATGKSLLMMQEDLVQQPLDYRDIVASYTQPSQVSDIVREYVRDVIALLQDPYARTGAVPTRFLERLELGDIAAENESIHLDQFYVRTSQFNDARRGHARLVVGRKGAGKTALFLSIRNAIPKSHRFMVLDLKPQGHQFTRLREVVLEKLTRGVQEHTLAAFWNYILLCEMAHFIKENDYSWAQRDEERRKLFERICAAYGKQESPEGDFSERLLHQVDRLVGRFEAVGASPTSSDLTEMLFRTDIRLLDDALAPYLQMKEAAWVLVDNLDKGWPTRGARSTDILILRALLESTRKLQKQFEQRGVPFHCLLFLRNDIHDHLVLETPDRGKDTAINLDWDDREVFKELLRRRITSSGEVKGTFDEVWPRVIVPYIGTISSFDYLVDRTLMRPRDLLMFVRQAVGVAINRGHERILVEDVKKAEEAYSEEMLLNTSYELADVYPELVDVLYMFMADHRSLDEEQALACIAESMGGSAEKGDMLELLLWFGFLGIEDVKSGKQTYSYQVRYNIEKLRTPVRRAHARYVVHPAFHAALGISHDFTKVRAHDP